MQGYNVLWQPGTDHASIATEVKITEKLKEEGIDKHELGREKFLERAWAWKKEYGGRIIRRENISFPAISHTVCPQFPWGHRFLQALCSYYLLLSFIASNRESGCP